MMQTTSVPRALIENFVLNGLDSIKDGVKFLFEYDPDKMDGYYYKKTVYFLYDYWFYELNVRYSKKYPEDEYQKTEKDGWSDEYVSCTRVGKMKIVVFMLQKPEYRFIMKYSKEKFWQLFEL